jgi:peptide chain release factor subunit 3
VFYATPGENIKIKIKGIEEEDLLEGTMICNQDDVCMVTQEIECEINILELPEHKAIFSTGY